MSFGFPFNKQYEPSNNDTIRVITGRETKGYDEQIKSNNVQKMWKKVEEWKSDRNRYGCNMLEKVSRRKQS